ncbi:MAG: hypothetical protein CMN55_08340 [Sneathiella sp.]|jgi:DNA-directed RNA polymerase subunit H (RpoH/RPB5)|uniref:hypothetical protein n=1 Tax=Sneathiella sp. TaxID=1964365 RepID=UPI000C4746E8|nr:hypothetical protein [Sneathiella sp.]MAL79106.1 hypothetical protein [Sneathiella sp.]|tara:strand:- start:12725 stop:12913 length:189 start_codon:yes stop_codon:yes gene_type:complete
MQNSRFGEAAPKISDKEIFISEDNQTVLLSGWEVSEETLKEIDEIDANIRAAEQKSGMFLMG